MLQETSGILKSHNLRNTQFRQLVLNVFLKNPSLALSHSDIEEALGDHDRITLYRTLKSFEESGLIHKALDGGNENKFALCQDDCDEHSHSDDHPHFLCQSCGNTYCLDMLEIPKFQLPAGYKLKEVRLAMSGICDQCNR